MASQINPVNVVTILLGLVSNAFPANETNGSNDNKMANQLFATIKTAIELEIENDEIDNQLKIYKGNHHNDNEFSLETKSQRVINHSKIYEYYTKNNYNRSKTQSAYRISKTTTSKIIKNNGGSIKEENTTKTYQLKQQLYNKFLRKRIVHSTISDMTLQQWAMKIANNLKMNVFTASDSFITKFKSDYNIVSRKISNFVDRNTLNNLQLSEIKNTFSEKIKLMLQTYENIYNFDQTGINYNTIKNRTLAEKVTQKY